MDYMMDYVDAMQKILMDSWTEQVDLEYLTEDEMIESLGWQISGVFDLSSDELTDDIAEMLQETYPDMEEEDRRKRWTEIVVDAAHKWIEARKG